jgi:hypothetical protein
VAVAYERRQYDFATANAQLPVSRFVHPQKELSAIQPRLQTDVGGPQVLLPGIHSRTLQLHRAGLGGNYR